ncbi:MAG: lytic transglycosylase domain-containing protein [Roseococcus sp.]|nr:lytic transglycosylase domain-containing protein [Roseococcus sp.]
MFLLPVPRARGLAPLLMAVLALALLSACAQAPQRGASAPQPRSYAPPGPPHDPWGPWIREASRRFDVPERWIREVMRQESGGRATATSPVGAMGLMQVMPGTYRELQRRYDLGDDPYHPYDNIMAGTAYIREMYDLYGSPAFLAAYNAGPRRLEDYLYNNRGLPAETRNYVARVGPGVIRASPVRRAPPEVYAAAEIPLNIPPGPRRMDRATQLALAEQRSIREQNARSASPAPAEPTPAPTRLAAAPASNPVVGGSILRAGGVVAMAPIPDGATPEGAARLAEAEARAAGGAAPPAGGELLPDGRIIVARMDPIPDGATPEGAARLAEAEARAAGGAPITGAPPARDPSGMTDRRDLTGRPGERDIAAARLVPLPPPPVAARPEGRRLGLIGAAQASTLPAGFRPASAPAGGQWAIQVGAFGSPEQARQAAQAAAHASGGRVQVTPVQAGRATLFRARVVGLSQSGAQQACQRMRGPCNVLAPGAQG